MAINKFKEDKKRRAQDGFLVIEILTVVAIIGISLTSLLGAFSLYLRTKVTNQEIAEANALAQGAIEAARSFRDRTEWEVNGLGFLVMGIDYHPQLEEPSSGWSLNQGTETINGFTRRIVFENGLRDSNDNLVESGGSSDSDTKKTTVFVTWRDKEIKIITYLTNWQED